ncbi:MAG: EamA family transporter [Anaerotignum sp.]|jgi:drug/metabolite transporter (DMT)-like permease|nr:EamA family transporter [Anaerotignum sp.]
MSYILVLIAGVSWGLIGVFTKVIDVLGFTEMQMLFVKGVLATTVLFIITFFKDKKQLKLKNWKDIRYFVGTGIISFTFFSWAYMKAVNLTSLGVAAVLLYTAPTFVMLFSILLFGEKMTKTKGIVLLMTFVGCILVTGLLEGGAAVITWQGIGIGIAAGVGYALYSIFGTYAIRAGYGSLTISFYTFLMATVIMTFLVEPVAVVSEITEMGQWPLAISFALLTTVVPYLTYTKGLSGLPASKASVTATIEPVVAALLGIFVFHESVTMLKITGIVLVLSSVVVMSRQEQK